MQPQRLKVKHHEALEKEVNIWARLPWEPRGTWEPWADGTTDSSAHPNHCESFEAHTGSYVTRSNVIAVNNLPSFPAMIFILENPEGLFHEYIMRKYLFQDFSVPFGNVYMPKHLMNV